MINIRYHIFSLVAVFVALFVGLAAGSTVVRESLVNSLEDNQARLENRLDELQATNDELGGQIDALEQDAEALLQDGPASLLVNEVAGVPVLLLFAEGADDGTLQSVGEALTVGGVDPMGTIQLRRSLASDDAAPALADLLGVQGSPEQLRAELTTRLAGLLVTEAQAVPEPPATTTTVATTEDTGPPGATAPGEDEEQAAPTSAVDSSHTAPPVAELPETTVAITEPDVTDGNAGGEESDVVEPSATHLALVELLDSLEDAGFAEVDGQVGEAGTDLRFGVHFVMVGGRPDNGDENLDTAPDATSLLFDLVSAMAGEERVGIVAGDTRAPVGDGPTAPFVARVRDDGRLSDEVSTVDDLETFAGVAALVLATADLAFGTVGHYGSEDGADALLPRGA